MYGERRRHPARGLYYGIRGGVQIRLLPAFCLFLLGCGGGFVDPELKAFVDDFSSSVRPVPPGLVIRFSENRNLPDVSGVYELKTNRFLWFSTTEQIIEIDRNAFRGFSYFERRVILFHELGHAVMVRGHNSTFLSSGCPFSLMAPNCITFTPCYQAHWADYLAELVH